MEPAAAEAVEGSEESVVGVIEELDAERET